MTKQDDGLFLLEVLIDKVVFVKSPCFSDKDFRTCLSIECASIEPLQICDDDPGACTSKSMGPFVKNFNSGKSCLFSLKESEISAAMNKFPVKISVFKSLPCGCLPTKIIMGEATIDMTKEFIEARKKFLSDPNNVSYQALKDSFRIFGPDGGETGEIVMFLRISCFGKLIITRFQGGGPPTLSAGGNNAIVDRSCNPQKEFQSAQDPCACGAAVGGGGAGTQGGASCTMGGGTGGGAGGVCPPARDPYSIMPCQDPDDPCYCTGPKSPAKEQMVCRNTDQYCLHIPKGELPNLPYSHDVTEEQKLNIMATIPKDRMVMGEVTLPNLNYERRNLTNESADYIKRPSESLMSSSILPYSHTSIKPKKISCCDYINNPTEFHNILDDSKSQNNVLFGAKEISVYMTLFDELSHNRSFRTRSTAGTQATASMNKCFQVNNESSHKYLPSSTFSNSYNSSCTMSTLPCNDMKKIDRMRYSDVYFFGRKTDSSNPKRKEMGKEPKSVRLENTNSTTAQTNRVTGASTGTSTKTVSIKDNKICDQNTCPALAQPSKGEMVAIVSHIKLGPREPCPIHGKEPCQGPKCIVASSGEEKAPVKVTTMSNPRRGVFELIIRRMNGAPLAKNELMLEWTPPPYQTPCGLPCSIPCAAAMPPCHPSKCKIIVCRPSSCKPKGCRKPCGPPYRCVPCSFCKKPCGKPCKPRKPCPPPRCKPFSPCRSCKPCRPCPPPRRIFKQVCPSPCCKPCGRCSACSPCGPALPCQPPPPCRSCRRCKPRSPLRCRSCKRCRPCPPSPCRPCPPLPCRPRSPCQPSSPCRPFPPPPCRPCRPCSPCPPCPALCTTPSNCGSPCRVKCRKTRKCKSHPRIRSHRKRISPCNNRSKCCPVVRCRSLPGPCIGYCSVLPPLPRNCCQLSCKPPRCKSSCSTCCT